MELNLESIKDGTLEFDLKNIWDEELKSSKLADVCKPQFREVFFSKICQLLRHPPEKYCTDYAIERFERIVSASALIRDQALQLLILATWKGWRNLGEAAARNTPFVPLNKEVAIEGLNCVAVPHATRLSQEVQSRRTDES